MKKPIVALIAISLLFLGVSGRDPDQTESQLLTINQAISVALSGNAQIQSANQELKAARARRLQAEAMPDPSLTMETAGLPSGLKHKAGQETEIFLGVEQFIEYPARRKERIKISQYDEELVELNLNRISCLVTARVKKAYYRAVLHERMVDLMLENFELLDKFLDLVRVNYEAGRAKYADVLRLRIEKAKLKNQLIEQARVRDEARAELNLLLGRRAEERLELEKNFVFIPFSKSFEEVKQEALAESASLKLAALKQEQASSVLKLSWLNRRPDFQVGFFAPSKRLNAWGFSLSINLPLSKKMVEGERLEAAANLESMKISVRAMERSILTRLQNYYQAVKATAEQVRMYEETLMMEVENELKINLEYYKFGQAEAFVLLDLFRNYLATRVDHLQALYLYQISLVDLEASGEEDTN